ncbi:MAG TPA: hypothetical protein VHE81_14020 [Lacipirellulaceae bacterium]|nr:hypothetical protein [Lacipirellulaceae bacterium]
MSDRSDEHHVLFKRLIADPPKLITTVFVAAEGRGSFLRRYGRPRALQFLAMIEEMRHLSMLNVGPKECGAAVAMLRKFSDQDLTIPDALGLQVIAVRKIKRCWSTDSHLGITGVPLVIHSTE